ncbi:MAG: NUDIX hydrolase [Ornithinibacter sp.]
MPEPLADVRGTKPVLASERVFQGRVWDVRSEQVDLGEAGVVTRDFVDHTGAVAIVALDEEGRVVLVQQYRHPVRATEWELPAGLLDIDGEPPHHSAARELLEETDLRAEQWHVVLDHNTTPGGSSEVLRIYLARGLSSVPDDERHARDGEELGMPVRRVPLDELVDAALGGRVHNATLLIGALAAAMLRDRDWVGLLPADAPWPTRSPGRR